MTSQGFEISSTFPADGEQLWQMSPAPQKMAGQVTPLEDTQQGASQTTRQFKNVWSYPEVQTDSAPANTMRSKRMRMSLSALQAYIQPAQLSAVPDTAMSSPNMGMAYYQQQQEFGQPVQRPAMADNVLHAQAREMQYKAPQQSNLPAQEPATPDSGIHLPCRDEFFFPGMQKWHAFSQHAQLQAVPVTAAPFRRAVPVSRDDAVRVMKAYVRSNKGAYNPDIVGKIATNQCVEIYLAGSCEVACKEFRRRAQRSHSQQMKRKESSSRSSR